MLSPKFADLSPGSAADVCELRMKDQIVAVNKKDISHMTKPQVQRMIEDSVKIGQIELKVKRPINESGKVNNENLNVRV